METLDDEDSERAGGGLLLAGAIAMSWPYWTFLWDGYGHRGLFRCYTKEDENQRLRLCLEGADGLVFEEVKLRSGEVRRSWYAGGVYEYAREVKRPGQGWIMHRRLFVDSWDRAGENPPTGRSGVRCMAE